MWYKRVYSKKRPFSPFLSWLSPWENQHPSLRSFQNYSSLNKSRLLSSSLWCSSLSLSPAARRLALGERGDGLIEGPLHGVTR